MSFVLFVPRTAWKKIGFFLVLLCVSFPASVHAASLSFVPRERTYDVGTTFTVTVSANSGGSALNAVSGTVSFPTSLLEVVSVSKATSMMSLWVQEPSFSNEQGTVEFEGIVLNPGYTGTNGSVVSITFRAKSSGVANLSFPNGSILANDGSGSEILSSRGAAVFTLAKPQAVAVDTLDEQTQQHPDVTVTSEDATAKTHGDAPLVAQSAVGVQGWSKESSATFTFAYDPSVTTLRLLLDSNPHSTPVVEYTPPITSKEIQDLPSGTSYLHVQTKTAAGWSAVTHHKITIDVGAPESLVVTEQKNRDENSVVKVFTLHAEDSLSGIERFEVVLDGAPAEVLTAAAYVTYLTPVLAPGTHTLMVRSFDKAGNITEKVTEFVVTKAVSSSDITQETTEALSVVQLVSAGTAFITILSVIVPTLALIFLLCAVLLFGLRQYKKYKKQVHTEVAEAKEVTRRVFALITNELDADILLLEKARKKRKLSTEETKLLKHIKQNIAGAEKMISDELQDIVE